MGEMAADVAVVVPAYNAEATIGRAVESVLTQRGVAVELVVVDDCSRDATLERVHALAAADPRVQALPQPHNQGPAAARNAAIAATRAPWIALLDADDFMAPTRLAALLALAQREGADFVADDVHQVSEEDVAGPRRRLWSDAPIGLQTIDLVAFIEGNISARHGDRRELGFVKPLMRRAFLDDAGLRYDESMRLGEDYDLYARALTRGARFLLTDPCGYVAVMRANSLSGRHGARDLAGVVRADRRLLDDGALDAPGRRAVRAHYLETQKKWRWVRLIDAVKARDPLEACRCFNAPAPVIGALLANLAEQAVIRGRRRLIGG